MTYLIAREKSFSGGKDNADYRKQEVAIKAYVKTYGLFVSPSPSETTSPLLQQPAEIPRNSAANSKEAVAINSNLEKFAKLVETCYRRGKPSETELQLLERFRQKYAISQEEADKLIAKFSPSQDQQEAIYEFGLTYRAFLENDAEIDFEEQSQLLELQEDLGLTNEQVSTIEANVRQKLGL